MVFCMVCSHRWSNCNVFRIQQRDSLWIEHRQVLSYTTQVLQDLHWVPVHTRADFKILILVFMAIHRLAPLYISDLISVKPKSSYNLRSNSSLLLEPPKEKMLSMLGARSFYAAAPYSWTSLPSELHDIQSLSNFNRKLLKTHLFRAG